MHLYCITLNCIIATQGLHPSACVNVEHYLDNLVRLFSSTSLAVTYDQMAQIGANVLVAKRLPFSQSISLSEGAKALYVVIFLPNKCHSNRLCRCCELFRRTYWEAFSKTHPRGTSISSSIRLTMFRDCLAQLKTYTIQSLPCQVRNVPFFTFISRPSDYILLHRIFGSRDMILAKPNGKFNHVFALKTLLLHASWCFQMR
jgi:hypothetical protein